MHILDTFTKYFLRAVYKTTINVSRNRKSFEAVPNFKHIKTILVDG